MLTSGRVVLLSTTGHRARSRGMFRRLSSLTGLTLTNGLRKFPPEGVTVAGCLMFNGYIDDNSVGAFGGCLSRLRRMCEGCPSVPQFCLFSDGRACTCLVGSCVVRTTCVSSYTGCCGLQGDGRGVEHVCLGKTGTLTVTGGCSRTCRGLVSIVRLKSALS